MSLHLNSIHPDYMNHNQKALNSSDQIIRDINLLNTQSMTENQIEAMEKAVSDYK